MKKTLRKILSGVTAAVIAGSMGIMTGYADDYSLAYSDFVYKIKQACYYKHNSPEETPEYYLNPENITWQNGDSSIKGYANGELLECGLLGKSVVIVVPEDIDVTNEYLGLSESYTIEGQDSQSGFWERYVIKDSVNLDGKKLYMIENSSSDDNSDALQAMKNAMIDEKIDAAFDHRAYDYEVWIAPTLTISLKTPDEEFSPDKFEGLKGLDYIQMDESGLNYSVDISSLDFKDFDNIINEVNNDENTASTDIPLDTDLIGRVTFSSIQLDIRIDGDSNSDNRLNIRDAAFIARKLVERNNEELPEYADYNLDGEINIRDAAGIARFLVDKNEK